MIINSTLLIVLLLNSLFIVGLSAITYIEFKTNSPNRITRKNLSPEHIELQDSQLLWIVRYFLLKTIGFKWSKPLLTCPTCMASVHGTIWFFGLVYQNCYMLTTLEIAVSYVGYMITLAGLNTITSKLSS
jgi:acyl-CoA thioesterase